MRPNNSERRKNNPVIWHIKPFCKSSRTSVLESLSIFFCRSPYLPINYIWSISRTIDALFTKFPPKRSSLGTCANNYKSWWGGQPQYKHVSQPSVNADNFEGYQGNCRFLQGGSKSYSVRTWGIFKRLRNASKAKLTLMSSSCYCSNRVFVISI